MPADSLPVLGAALPVAQLADYRAWLLDGQRDLEIQDAVFADVLDGDWSALAHQARAALEGHTGRVGIHGPYDGLTLMSRDPRVRTLVADRLQQALELGALFGATHMVVHSPFIFFGDPFLPHTPAFDLATQVELIKQTLAPVVPLAERLNITIVIEDIQDKNPAPLLATVRALDSSHVRLSIDVGHAYLMHRAGGPSPDAWVREAGDLLAHLHLQDNDGLYDRHWAPGDGAINWYALFEALASLSHQPRLILEMRDKAHIRRGADWLSARGLAR